MTDDIISKIIDSTKEISPSLGISIQTALKLVPYVGKCYSRVKFNRLNSRVKAHRNQLQRIGQLRTQELLNADYINERIFPIVLEQLIEEHEDAKVNFILNGFENVFIEEKSSESLVLNYFDTLRELRYLDIKRLFYLSSLIEEFNYDSEEEEAIIFNIDNKLQSLGLIRVEITGITFDGGWERENEMSKDNVKDTSYGKAFLDFITEN